MPGTHGPNRFGAITFADIDTGVGLGGNCVEFVNNAGVNLLLGDIVYIGSGGDGQVTKGAVAASYVTYAGVVVGGARTGMAYVTDSAQYGVTVAAAQLEAVLVQYDGIAYVVADAAIARGARLQQGAITGGRVDDPAFVAGQGVGISLGAPGAAAAVFKMFVVKM